MVGRLHVGMVGRLHVGMVGRLNVGMAGCRNGGISEWVLPPHLFYLCLVRWHWVLWKAPLNKMHYYYYNYYYYCCSSSSSYSSSRTHLNALDLGNYDIRLTFCCCYSYYYYNNNNNYNNNNAFYLEVPFKALNVILQDTDKITIEH